VATCKGFCPGVQESHGEQPLTIDTQAVAFARDTMLVRPMSGWLFAGCFTASTSMLYQYGSPSLLTRASIFPDELR
jgi:hypothetical protein